MISVFKYGIIFGIVAVAGCTNPPSTVEVNTTAQAAENVTVAAAEVWLAANPNSTNATKVANDISHVNAAITAGEGLANAVSVLATDLQQDKNQ